MPRWRRLTLAFILALLTLASLYVLLMQAAWHVKVREHQAGERMFAALDRAIDQGLLALPDPSKKTQTVMLFMDDARRVASPIELDPLYPVLAALLCLIALTLLVTPRNRTTTS